MATHSHRKTPSRAALTRRTTKGPLDEVDDPLSATDSESTPQSSQLVGKSDKKLAQDADETNLLTDDVETQQLAVVGNNKDLSFLLDRSVYHPLSQIDVPVPFRRPFPPVPPPGSTPKDLLRLIDLQIADGNFLGAAHLSAICLTSGLVRANDNATIFKLLATRYSCLEITGQLALAAQEAKALEDLSSEFYYVIKEVSLEEAEAHDGQKPIAQHIMPFTLRIQATRLQNIGFSDPRRGVTMLYDLVLEARENMLSKYVAPAESEVWSRRLESLSMHVVNGLIELGDLDCAERTIAQSKPSDPRELSRWACRNTLLLVKLGKIAKARAMLAETDLDVVNELLIESLLAMADGDFEKAVELLHDVSAESINTELRPMIQQNLAVALLYTSHVADAKSLLVDLLDSGHNFSSLTVNLATVLELTSEKSREEKLALVDRLALLQAHNKPLMNADFKL